MLQERPQGLKKLHVATASVDVKTGALLGFYGGQNYLDSQLNWARLGGSPGSSFKPFALAAGLKDGFSLKDTFDGNAPFVLPDGGGEVGNQGEGQGRSYGSAHRPGHGDRELREHRVRRPDDVHGRGPAEGRPAWPTRSACPRTRPGSSPSPLSPSGRRR